LGYFGGVLKNFGVFWGIFQILYFNIFNVFEKMLFAENQTKKEFSSQNTVLYAFFTIEICMKFPAF
jgi:hypothetical protein